MPTQLLDQAFARAATLPESDQDAIAAIVLAELEDEERWQAAFARSQDQLAALANRVREDIRAGRVRKMGVDEL